MKFMKWHGAGNDFIIVESESMSETQAEKLAIQVCDRRFGVGADGLLIASQSEQADMKMRYYNSDGSFGAMCGNGIRCFSAFCRYKGLVTRETITIETGDGFKTVTVKINDGYNVQVDMGQVVLEPTQIPVALDSIESFEEVTVLDKTFRFMALKVGVPHIVIEGPYTEADVLLYGPLIENCPLFPEKTNVNFMEIEAEGSIRVTTWERGAGLTLACGTGACASAYVASRHFNVTQPVVVNVPGGQLKIEVNDQQLIMWGPAQPVAEGVLCL